MIELTKILEGVTIKSILGNEERLIEGVHLDSRKEMKGGLFIAINGKTTDGHKYINQAEKNGASTIVYESEEHFEINSENTYIKVNDSSKAAGILASNFFGKPSLSLKLIGITGTNGKTTVASLLFDLLNSLGYNCGLISTIKVGTSKREISSSNTTPDVISINEYLKEMVDNDVKYCFMEVSSHGIDQNRVFGLNFSGGVFTNLSHDHLDYHKTFKNYIYTKKLFFDSLPKSSFVLTNIDDKNGSLMVQNTKAKMYSYSLFKSSDFKTKIISNGIDGMNLKIGESDIWTRLYGEYNAYNLTAVYGVANILGVKKDKILNELSNLYPPEGRTYSLKLSTGGRVIIDYAHTPDALQKLLATIKSIKGNDSRMLTVVGCGGNRDKSKRPKMAKVASLLSDKVFITSDNPRFEDPIQIIDEMMTGIEENEKTNVIKVIDRKEAIYRALEELLPNDIAVIAGKGHEKYQDVAGHKLPFDEIDLIKKHIKQQHKN